MPRPTLTVAMIRLRGCHPSCCAFQRIRLLSPHGLVRVRSPLLTESRLMSFPPGTEMFQFPGFALKGLCIQPMSTWFTRL